MPGELGEFMSQVVVVPGAIYRGEIDVLGEGGGHGNHSIAV